MAAMSFGDGALGREASVSSADRPRLRPRCAVRSFDIPLARAA